MSQAFGVDAADVEISTAVLVDELGALSGEQRVDALVLSTTRPCPTWGASSGTRSMSGASAISVQPMSRS